MCCCCPYRICYINVSTGWSLLVGPPSSYLVVAAGDHNWIKFLPGRIRIFVKFYIFLASWRFVRAGRPNSNYIWDSWPKFFLRPLLPEDLPWIKHPPGRICIFVEFMIFLAYRHPGQGRLRTYNVFSISISGIMPGRTKSKIGPTTYKGGPPPGILSK